MPNKILDQKPNWEAIKKDLPKNWCQLVSNALINKGLYITPQAVSDLRAGRIKNLSHQAIVMKEIKKIIKRQKKAQEVIASAFLSQQ